MQKWTEQNGSHAETQKGEGILEEERAGRRHTDIGENQKFLSTDPLRVHSCKFVVTPRSPQRLAQRGDARGIHRVRDETIPLQ